MTAEPTLRVTGLSVAYGDVVAVHDATFSIAVGEACAITGAIGPPAARNGRYPSTGSTRARLDVDFVDRLAIGPGDGRGLAPARANSSLRLRLPASRYRRERGVLSHVLTARMPAMSPDPRARRAQSRPRGKDARYVPHGPSPEDMHEVMYFRRHREDDPARTIPGREALTSWPSTIRARMRTLLTQIAMTPPRKFSGGGKWEAMGGAMTGWFQAKADGPGRHHYRLFCLLDYDAKDHEKPLLVVVAGLDKPFKTEFQESAYARVRALGAEYLSRNPRSLA